MRSKPNQYLAKSKKIRKEIFMFECFSPCIKCAEQGFTYDANSRFCQKCQFFILVHVVEKVVSKNPECKYCKLEKDCTSPCDFVFDFEKLISEYAEHLENKRQFYKDLEEQFSKKKSSSTKVTSVLIFVIVVLVIVVVNLVLRIRKEDEDFDSWSEPQSGKRQKSGENMNKKELESRRKNRMENISIKELELGKNSRSEENQNHESKPQRTNYQAQKLETETQIKNRKVHEGQPDAVVQKPILADELQKILRGEQASQRKGVSQETKMMHKSESQNSQERIQKENVQNPGPRMEQEKRTPQNTPVKEPDDYFEVIDLEDL